MHSNNKTSYNTTHERDFLLTPAIEISLISRKMKSTTILNILLSTSIALASPLGSGRRIQPEAVYSMKSFTTRKDDGKTINTVSFSITSADGGALDFTCNAYDPTLGHATESFEIGKIYPCGKDSSFLFSYTPDGDEKVDDLVLWRRVSATETWKGSTTPASEICRTSGNATEDLICVAPDQEDSYVEMRKSEVKVEGWKMPVAELRR